MLRSASLLALCVLAAVPARAETLVDAIVDAYRTNPQLQAQRAELRALDESVIQAGAPYRLGADVSATLGYSDRLQRSAIADGFARFEQRSMGASVSLTQLLSSGGRTAAQVSAAEADVLAGRERLRNAENQILYTVVEAYMAVRRDEELVDIQGRAVASYDRQVAQTRAREREGDLTRTDIAQAEAQLLIIRAALAQTQASLEQSRSRFAAAVGRNPGHLEMPPTLAGLPPSVDAAYLRAGRESPILWQAIMIERSSRHRIAAERAERNPSISAQGNFGYVNPLGYQVRDLGRTVSGGITVTVPILTRGVVGSRVRAAIADQQSAAFQVEDARRTVDAGVLNAWNQSVTAHRQIDAGEAAVAAARTALDGVRRAFAEGFRSSFELIDSEQRLLNAQVIVANARYGGYTGEASLLALLGRLDLASLLPDAPRYDPTAGLRTHRAWQFGPFEPLLEVLDRPQMPSDHARPAPAIAAPGGHASLAPSQSGASASDLARGLPLGTHAGSGATVSTDIKGRRP
ncbi:TolC family outer membrane protein [Sphingomonas sp. A2-49]|uniref:TolC family outer membrane protein n=1 Tax=Sphingomonas sp. A2-49 TaxID=1391375 RepID=UPI0021D3EBC1|nr:TolC family outer membrane protein [Sphingomonas sp. A2-49]MCU6453897.1 TolC family outer membrane protein [Sphingomonas sp. A2-49]